ncbi:MAG: tetratricopeptide repeat protein [Fluviicola sp.]|nr:tetratricopeptide repeat protein [Fluviicola sp.]
MKKNYSILVVALFLSLFSYSQNLDSLLSVWGDSNNQDSTRVKALHDVAWKLAFKNPDSSIVLANLELDFNIKINKEVNNIGTYNVLGVASIIDGEYINALDYFEKAIKRANIELKSKDAETVEEAKKGLAQTYINRGILYKNQGDYAKALTNQLKSVAIWEELKEEQKVAIAYGNIGVIYRNLKEYDKSMSYHLKGIEIKKRSIDSNKLAVDYSNLGTLYKTIGKLDSAMIFLQKSLAFELKSDNKKGLANSYGAIGNLYRKMNDLPNAIKYQKKGLEIDKQTSQNKSTANSYVNLGESYLTLKQYGTSIDYLNKALELSSKIGALKEQKYARRYLADVYEAKGDFKKAMVNYKEFIVLRDSLINENTHREVTRAEIRSEFNRKEYADSLNRQHKKEIRISEQSKKDELKEVEIKQQKYYSTLALIGAIILAIMLVIVVFQVLKHKKSNVILNIQKKKIEKSDKEKEVLIREIHHRVKNNLQIISSLLKAEQRKSSSEDVKSALTYGRQRIEAISFVHEKLYLQTDLANVDLEDYLLDLAENLLTSYDKTNQIELNIHSRVRNLDADVAVNLGLLTAELITNSIKHGFSESSEGFIIETSLKKEEDYILFKYADNGKEIVDMSKMGNSDSFGIKLVLSIVKKMNGEIISDTSKGGFSLVFKFKSNRNE